MSLILAFTEWTTMPDIQSWGVHLSAEAALRASVFIAALLVIVWRARPKNDTLTGIQGWLYVFIALHCLAIAARVETYLVARYAASPPPGSAGTLVPSLIAFRLLLTNGFDVAVASACLRKSWWLKPLYAIRQLVMTGAFLASAAQYDLLHAPMQRLAHDPNALNGFAEVLQGAAWLAYLYRSRRVANTLDTAPHRRRSTSVPTTKLVQ